MKKRLTFRHRLICALPYSLIHFLINHGCFELFVHNVCNKSIQGADMCLLKALENKRLDPTMIITCAFTWKDTHEGYIFWFRKSIWYEEYYKEINKY